MNWTRQLEDNVFYVLGFGRVTWTKTDWGLLYQLTKSGMHVLHPTFCECKLFGDEEKLVEISSVLAWTKMINGESALEALWSDERPGRFDFVASLVWWCIKLTNIVASAEKWLEFTEISGTGARRRKRPNSRYWRDDPPAAISFLGPENALIRSQMSGPSAEKIRIVDTSAVDGLACEDPQIHLSFSMYIFLTLRLFWHFEDGKIQQVTLIMGGIDWSRDCLVYWVRSR